MPHLTKDDLAAFLPHAGSMRLLDRAASWDESSIRCHTKTHHDPENPLRRGACLEAVAGIEYAAQAMGVHVGLLYGGRSPDGSIGYVGGVREVVFGIDRLDDCPDELTIDATRLFTGYDSYLYRFVISSGGREVMSGRASIFLKRAPA
jgi:predicted hotdog family 3-hydroxylacyl-ACP dehydratase